MLHIAAPNALCQRADAVPARDASSFREAETPGWEADAGFMRNGGYCGPPVQAQRFKYRPEDASRGEAIVDVVQHAADYTFAVHDFFGTFDAFLRDDDPADSTFRFVRWSRIGGTAVVCDARRPDGDRLRGLIGWFREAPGGVVTVLIGYEDLDGPPAMLVDDYLKLHPSTVVADTASSTAFFDRWRTDDVSKWIAVLEARGDEDGTLRRAAARLRRYDGTAFGMADCVNWRNDSDRRSRGLASATSSMRAWLRQQRDARGVERR
ncbi:MAG: hypothetical protein HOP29_05185 [Phycisphaerales bacterium]|nr:hypothetical protein [Phycisphaerales bacterium]